MLRVISRAALATAMRSAVANSRVILHHEGKEALIECLAQAVEMLSVSYQPPKTVLQSEHDLLQMKYNTALQLIGMYERADANRQAQDQTGTRSAVRLPENRRNCNIAFSVDLPHP